MWASRLLGSPLPERVAGIDLMLRLFELAERRGLPVYILGARQEVLEQAVAKLRERHPRCASPATATATSTRPRRRPCARRSAPRARSCCSSRSRRPRKEYFLGEHGPALGVPFVMGVGGAIDVVAGITKRAPAMWQRAGLEWLYRLLQEPRRMFGRYVRTNTRFMWLVGRALVAGSGR